MFYPRVTETIIDVASDEVDANIAAAALTDVPAGVIAGAVLFVRSCYSAAYVQKDLSHQECCAAQRRLGKFTMLQPGRPIDSMV
jgi:hypothetical protein